jgi:hypothetical protein
VPKKNNKLCFRKWIAKQRLIEKKENTKSKNTVCGGRNYIEWNE